MKKYIPGDIENKWQQKWSEAKLYSTDLTDSKKHYYVLVEFSYPSGDLHMGHWFAFAVPDILARLKRMQGFNVFFPNGFDAFGLPAENAAIKRGIHPQDWTLGNIEKMKGQFNTMGASFDWSHEVITCLPEYYKWNQWIFLKMYQDNLAYKGKMFSNWCPVDQCVLANENVEAGKCWRCGSEVVQKEVDQWFLKLTAYADKLLWEKPLSNEPSNGVDWPIPVKVGQNNWIGKSEGINFRYKVKDMDIYFEMFDSVPQTFMAQTFTVIAPEHPQLAELVKGTEHEKEVLEFVDKIRKKKAANKFDIEKEPEGVFTGRYIEYAPTGKDIPIWVASFVIAGYGSGVVNASAHDERDFAFAKKYNLPLHPVMFPQDPDEAKKVRNLEYCYHHAQDGILEEPIEFKGREWGEVRGDIIDFIEKKGFGKRNINYHLHDWSVSRQRYWGTPIPIIYCDNCGTVPVPEKDLPVQLPYEVDYAPQGKPPLATAQEWVNVKCPNCGADAKREVETMDTFVDSSWYFFRYLDPKNDKEIFNKEVIKNWLPVDIYFGGAEHTLGHTLYSRFFTKFLSDCGLYDLDEYANKRVNRGLILGPDGQKMSKSRGNVINPDDQVREYGADAVRLYLAFIGPYAETVTPWENSGVYAVYHFLQRVWSLQEKLESRQNITPSTLATDDLRIMHKTIKRVGSEINAIKFNTAVAALMEWLNHLLKKDTISLEEYKTYLLLLAPFAPHITEELFQSIDKASDTWSIHQQQFPSYDDKYLVEDEVTVAIQINGKVRDTLLIQKDILNNREVVENMAKDRQNIQKYLQNKTVKKVIYIPGKIINFVLG